MTDNVRQIQVLLVEDDPIALKQFERDLPETFQSNSVDARIFTCTTIEEGKQIAQDPLYRFDLIISDTYAGEHSKKDYYDALKLIGSYRERRRFCPIVLMSGSSAPPGFVEGPFMVWGDKSEPKGVEGAIEKLLSSGIPQAARNLHDELDYTAGWYLWDFLNQNWNDLKKTGNVSKETIERIIRNRAAHKIVDFDSESRNARNNRDGFEYYVYPPLENDAFRLGDIINRKDDPEHEIRVVLTPHCLLTRQAGQTQPSATHVLTLRTVQKETALASELARVKTLDPAKQEKMLKQWSRSPANIEKVKPKGRYWYLPGFLGIPDSFCDFLQVDSLPYSKLKSEYEALATLCSPYGEALQACFLSFYGAVGIPDIDTKSMRRILE